MVMLLLTGFLLAMFGMALLIAASLTQGEFSMKEKAAVVFEVYRYSVCFVMVLVFSVMTYTLLTTMLSGAPEASTLGGSGVAVLLSIIVYFIHWRLKNPALNT